MTKKISELTSGTPVAGDKFEFETAAGTSKQCDFGDLGAMLLIGSSSPSGTGTVTFSSIPTGYTDLLIVVRGRGTYSANEVGVQVTFNGDTGANYDSEYLQANSSTVSAGATTGEAFANCGAIPAANSTASNEPGHSKVTVFDYKGTTFTKKFAGDNGWRTADSAAGTITRQVFGNWSSTSAITSVTVALSNGNYVSGSKVSLYGIR